MAGHGSSMIKKAGGARRARVSGLVAAGLLLTLAAARAADAPPPEHPLLATCASSLDASCLSVLEARALRLHPALARRDGAQLMVGDGAPLVDAAAPGGLRHHYLGPLGDSGLQLVLRQQGDEPARFLALGPGALDLPWPAPPWPAPGGRLMVVAAPAAAGQSAPLWLLGRVGAHWRLLQRLEAAPGMGFTVLGWRADGAAVRLLWRCAPGGAGGATQLRDGPFGWDLQPAPPAGCR